MPRLKPLEYIGIRFNTSEENIVYVRCKSLPALNRLAHASDSSVSGEHAATAVKVAYAPLV